ARLERASSHAAVCLIDAAGQAGVPVIVNQIGSMLTLFFTDGPVMDYESAKTSDTARFATFFRAMLDRGVYLPPSQFEAAFLSDTMGDAEIELLLGAAREALTAI